MSEDYDKVAFFAFYVVLYISVYNILLKSPTLKKKGSNCFLKLRNLLKTYKNSDIKLLNFFSQLRNMIIQGHTLIKHNL